MKTYTKQDFHNPENITRQQVGEQHRLLLHEEVDGRFGRSRSNLVELVYDSKWRNDNVDGGCAGWTYRVPLATPLPDGTVFTSNECCFSDELHSNDGGFCTNTMPKRKRIYVAGGMTGYDDYNFPTFYAASESLERQGWEAVNPAQLDVDAGYTLERLKQFLPDELQKFLHGAIKRDLEALETCDAIALLPGWKSSKGARAEKAVAEWRGLEVYTLVPGQGDDEGEWALFLSEKRHESIDSPHLHPNDTKGAAGAKKPPMHLLPPDALIETAKAMGHGAAKYGAWNFIEAQVCASTYIGAIGRHWCEWSKNRDTDADSGLSHLVHIAANCFILLTAMQQGTLVDDRPKLK